MPTRLYLPHEAADIESHYETQRAVVLALVTYIPLIGILAVAVNIAIQVRSS